MEESPEQNKQVVDQQIVTDNIENFSKSNNTPEIQTLALIENQQIDAMNTAIEEGDYSGRLGEERREGAIETYAETGEEAVKEMFEGVIRGIKEGPIDTTTLATLIADKKFGSDKIVWRTDDSGGDINPEYEIFWHSINREFFKRTIQATKIHGETEKEAFERLKLCQDRETIKILQREYNGPLSFTLQGFVYVDCPEWDSTGDLGIEVFKEDYDKLKSYEGKPVVMIEKSARLSSKLGGMEFCKARTITCGDEVIFS